MKKLIYILLIVFAFSTAAHAKWLNVLIYCKSRPAEVNEDWREHPKDDVPDVGLGKLIRDFKLIASQGQKKFYHCIVWRNSNNTGLVQAVKDFFRTNNGCPPGTVWDPSCTTAIQDQYLYWWGETARDAYRQLWLDRSVDPFINAIAIRVLKYKVETTCDGYPCQLIVSLKDAVDVYGETINQNNILIPMEFFGR